MKWFFLLLLAAVAAAVGVWKLAPDSEAGKIVSPIMEMAWTKGQALWTQAMGRVAAGDARREEAFREPPPAPVEPPPAVTPTSPDTYLPAKALADKFALIYCFSSENGESVDLLARVEQIWKGFRHHPLVVLGSVRGEDVKAAKRAAKRAGVSFPVKAGPLCDKEPKQARVPYFVLLSPSGKVIFRGRGDREATEALVNALSEPRN